MPNKKVGSVELSHKQEKKKEAIFDGRTILFSRQKKTPETRNSPILHQ